MVHNLHTYADPTTMPVITWIQENPGHSLVLPSDCLSNGFFNLYRFDDPSRPKAAVSIVICTYGRSESLNDTLRSLTHQTFRDFEVILITEKGNLAQLRDKGLRASVGRITVFLDDDVCCEPTWLQAVIKAFEREEVVGVSGPTVITQEFRNKRDLFKFKWAKYLYDICFLGGKASYPGKLSKCGAPTTHSNDDKCRYNGRVDFLECCNMSVNTKKAIDAGGFDSIYIGTGEWAEVDLSLKLGKVGKLWFSSQAKLYHRPSQQGVYTFRLQTKHRWYNFMVFQRRWVRPSLTTYAYRSFIWLYFVLKQRLKF